MIQYIMQVLLHVIVKRTITYFDTASSVRASPVLCSPITTDLFSVNASLASFSIAGTLADMHMCLKKRYKNI